MIHFFGDPQSKIYALQSNADLHPEAIRKLSWLFGNMPRLDAASDGAP